MAIYRSGLRTALLWLLVSAIAVSVLACGSDAQPTSTPAPTDAPVPADTPEAATPSAGDHTGAREYTTTATDGRANGSPGCRPDKSAGTEEWARTHCHSPGDEHPAVHGNARTYGGAISGGAWHS